MSAQRKKTTEKRPPGRPPKGAKLVDGKWVKDSEVVAAFESTAPATDTDDGEDYMIVVEMERSSVTLNAPMGEYTTVYTCGICGASEKNLGVSRIARFCCACNVQMQWKSMPYSEDED